MPNFVCTNSILKIPNIMFDHRPTGSEIELRVLRVAIGESPGPEIPQNSEEPTKAVLVSQYIPLQ